MQIADLTVFSGTFPVFRYLFLMKYIAAPPAVARRHATALIHARSVLRGIAPERLPEGQTIRVRKFAEDSPPDVAYKDKRCIPKTDKLDRPARQIAWVKAAQKGCRRSAGLLLDDTDGLIWQVVRRWAHGAGIADEETLSDMHASVQMCLLEKAIPKFNPEKSGWVTYSWSWIRQACSRWTANHSRTVRIPVHLLERKSKVWKHAKRLAARLGRPPTDAELAKSVGIDEERIGKARARDLILSLDVAVDSEGKVSWLDLIEDVKESAEEKVMGDSEREAVQGFLEKLTEMERFVVEKRFWGEWTLKDIGDALGVSRERVRQIEARAIEKMRGMGRAW